MEYIARIHTPFPEKFGIPRQSGLAANAKGTIVFEPKFRNPDAVKGIEEFSHLWLLWEFSRAKQDSFHATVAPPRLGGKEKKGVCNKVSISTEFHWSFLCKARRGADR